MPIHSSFHTLKVANMKIVQLALVLSVGTALAVPTAVAAPGDDGNFFAEVKIGHTYIYDETHDTLTPSILAGYRWKISDGVAAGVALGYVDFAASSSGEPSITNAYYGEYIDASAVKVGANINFEIGRLYLEPRVGLMRLSATGSNRNGPLNPITDYDGNWTGAYLGIGAGYWITPDVAVGLNGDYHTAKIAGDSTSITTFSVGLEFQF
ncbi:MAG TPA: outer membrane beta-barrel protein [Gammaproteobacteria bacterium]|nr:outer membrane beta-barrel protein [Gammaproteobacteria bacterium]